MSCLDKLTGAVGHQQLLLLQVNRLASLIGDDRAARTRAKYGKPLKPVVMTDVGVLPIREPFPRPF